MKNRNKVVSARITEDELSYLKEQAAKRGLKVSDYIRELLTTTPATLPDDWWLQGNNGSGTFTVSPDTKWVTMNG